MPERTARTAAALSGLALLTGFALGLGRRSAPATRRAPTANQERTRDDATRDVRTGREAAGGFTTGWPIASAEAATAGDVEFQYAGLEHQATTALSGMWLFLGTEALFFGGLFLLYAVYRWHYPTAFAEASRHAQLAIGTANTAILLTSSAVFVYGLVSIQAGRARTLYHACLVTIGLGVLFLALKGWEWKLDLDDHLFPGRGFGMTGGDIGPAELFWSFYWIATALHGLHMIAGIILVGWLARAARARRFSAAYHTPVEVVGLYWSFVDMVWLMLYPSIYLIAVVARTP